MTSPPATPINVDMLMARVRDEAARHRQSAQSVVGESAAPAALRIIANISLASLPLPHLPKPQFIPAERYRLNDFLVFHDENFIAAAYRGVLNRNADPRGRAHFLASLR